MLLRAALDLARATRSDRFAEEGCGVVRAALGCRWAALLRLTADPGRDTIMGLAVVAGADAPVLARQVPAIRETLGPNGAGYSPQPGVTLLQGGGDRDGVAIAVVGADPEGRYVLVFDGRDGQPGGPRARAALFLPYLVEAIAARCALDELRARALVDTEVLDRAPCAFMVLGLDGAVLLVNAEARRIIASGDGLSLSGSRLVVDDAEFRRVLDGTLYAMANGGGLPDVCGLQVGRRSGSTPYAVALVPVSVGGTQAFVVPRRRLLVSMTDPVPKPLPAHDYLVRTFGLTASEARVCSQVAGGHELDDVAAALCLSPTTVKTHLRTVYHKLQVTSRAGLVRRAQGHCWAAGPVVVEVEGTGPPARCQSTGDGGD